ncbi:unnamed protein product, partial [Symbiodinium microadriaticum]
FFVDMISPSAALLCADILCIGLVLGSTVFFFFVQSPNLLLFMGREKFVTIQIKITEWFFRYIQVPLFVLLATSYYDGGKKRIISAAVALFGGVMNFVFVVPKALQAGKSSVAERKGRDGEGSLQKFAVEGAAKSTKFWHQTVVFFVVVMVVGLIFHAMDISSSLV